MAELKIKGISKKFGTISALSDINLGIKNGEFVVLVGPSGCGKSTLLRVIAGLEKQSEGEIYIDGEEVSQVTAAERGLAMVFQSYALYPHMSVYKNMAFGLENSKLPRSEIDLIVNKTSKMLRLEELMQRKPGELSGGQRQRVAIGRAMVRDPLIFLFDEPLSNLDAELRVAMRKELANLHEKLGTTMIYVTHDQVEAMTLADRIVIMNNGVVAQSGKPLDVYNKPENLFVAGFIGSPRMNIFEGTIENYSEGFTKIRFKNSIMLKKRGNFGYEGLRIFFGIRPEHTTLISNNEDIDPIPFKVIVNEQLGGTSFIYGETIDGQSIVTQQNGQNIFTRGENLNLFFDASNLHLFDSNGKRFSELKTELK